MSNIRILTESEVEFVSLQMLKTKNVHNIVVKLLLNHHTNHENFTKFALLWSIKTNNTEVLKMILQPLDNRGGTTKEKVPSPEGYVTRLLRGEFEEENEKEVSITGIRSTKDYIKKSSL